MTEERDAARAVQRVVGGTWAEVDTGAESAMFDVLHVLDDGVRIALEVTSDGSRFVAEASKALRKRTDRGDFDASSLSFLWQIPVKANTRIDALDRAAIETTLREFEARGVESVVARAFGEADEQTVWRLGIDTAVLWNRTPPGPSRGTWSRRHSTSSATTRRWARPSSVCSRGPTISGAGGRRCGQAASVRLPGRSCRGYRTPRHLADAAASR
jgi:hypothetical protein